MFALLAFTLASEGFAHSPFRVMTWNLEWFYDDQSNDNYSQLAKEQSAPSRDDWNWKRDGIARSIADLRPDVVAVQETENRRVLWYLTRSLQKNFQLDYTELALEGRDFYTEQDVGFLLRRDTADYRRQSLMNLSRQQREDERLMDLSKHMIITVEATPPGGGESEFITILNLHLRATEKATELRRRQARLMHSWVAKEIADGGNVIVLGDFNTELRSDPAAIDDDIGIAMGMETRTTADDLVDLTVSVPVDQRQTHVLQGRTFDRILVSKPLLQDAPDRIDLVFDNASVHPEASQRGSRDTKDDHWDNYWHRDESERDLSDHYPLIADFLWQ